MIIKIFKNISIILLKIKKQFFFNKEDINKEFRRLSKLLFTHFIAILIVSSVLIPYKNILFTSFIALGNRSSRGKPFTLENYSSILKNPILIRDLKNSLIISIGTTLLSVFVSLFAAYALSRIKFRSRKPVILGLFTIQMFPSVTFVVPFFILFLFLKRIFFIPMRNTYHGLIITYTSFSMPFTILMLRNYMKSIPKEIEEQAKIDGCNRTQILFKIIFPISLPGVITAAIYSFVISWNELLFAYTLTGEETQTISIGLLKDIFNSSFTNWCAACVLVTVPVVVIFMILQKYLIKGLGYQILK